MRIQILLLILFAIKSCKPAVKDPTDEEMMHHFNKHKTDFEMIRQVIAEDTISAFDYPPILVEEKYKKKIVLNLSVDEELIGGGIIKIGNKVIDGSIKSQIENIKKIF